MIGIVFNPILLQERHELLLEASLTMVFHLRPYISNRVALLRNPKGECAISFLPRKPLRVRLVHPMRGSSLDQLHRFGQRQRRRQREKYVSMILSTARNKRLESILAGHAAEKGPQLRLDLRRNQIAPLLGRENTMNKFGNVSVRHEHTSQGFKRPIRDANVIPSSLPGA